MKHDSIYPGVVKIGDVRRHSGGLTKREHFAGLALASLAEKFTNEKDCARWAVKYADALIKELEKE